MEAPGLTRRELIGAGAVGAAGAATETATRYWGDMDGAISAGERAASETMR